MDAWYWSMSSGRIGELFARLGGNIPAYLEFCVWHGRIIAGGLGGFPRPVGIDVSDAMPPRRGNGSDCKADQWLTS